jgi:TfoX/Sxy family transcriptional regulator of competence genes
MKPEDPLVARIRAALAPRNTIEKKMFGGTCFMLNDHMVAGTFRGQLLARVGKDQHAAAVALPHASAMEMNGREMEGYVAVAADGTASDADLQGWVDMAARYVRTLPPKPAKKKK